MPSTFFGLDIAYTGVLAANANVNTTAHNIANVETVGYSRQEAVQTAGTALKVSQSYGMAGTGVATTGIEQVRNKYYDMKYWDAQTNLGEYEMKQYYMYQIEEYFTDKDTVEGFEPLFVELFASLEEVYKQSGADAVKTQFLGNAQDLCTYFQAQANNLQKLQLSVNEEIRTKIDQINSISEQITTLNKQINTIEVTGNKANDLRDKRNLLVDELSKIVSCEVREVPIYISQESNVKSGLYNYEVTIAGGQQLVMGYDNFTLEYNARTAENRINQSDLDGLYEIQWSNGMEFSLYGKNLGGELKGLIEIRDGNNDEYFHGTTKLVEPVNKDISKGDPDYDEENEGMYKVTIAIDKTKPYLTDMNKCILPEQGRLTLLTSDYEYTSWTYNEIAGEYTFIVKPSDTVTDLAAGSDRFLEKEAQVGKGVDYMGIPYYQQQMNEWCRIFAKAMNEIELTAQDANGDPAEVLFTANSTTDKYNPLKFADSKTNDANHEYSSTSDDYYRLTAFNFVVNNEMMKDVRKFGTTYDINQGVDAQDITEKLLTVAEDKDRAAFRGGTSKEFLQCITADIALTTNNAVTFAHNYDNVRVAIQSQRLSVMAVDNDEEALNLVRFQEAYNLSAKVMQIMTEIYDRLILETGV